MTKNSIYSYIYRGQLNLLPTTLPRISRNTTTVFRLSRRLHFMKHHLVNWVNNFIR